MPAYVIADIQVTDPTAYEEYRKAATISMAVHGGRFMVRGGDSFILEGSWQPRRLVVIEFDSVDKARAWWDSPEYRAARDLRQRAAETNMIVVEGV